MWFPQNTPRGAVGRHSTNWHSAQEGRVVNELRCLSFRMGCLSGFRIAPFLLQSIHGAADAFPAAIQDMSVDHGGLDIFVSEEFLPACASHADRNGRNIAPGPQEMGGPAQCGINSGVAKGMTCRVLRDPGLSDGRLYSLLGD